MRKQVSAQDVPAELLPEQSVDLLKELHLLTRDGHLNADARRKLKQINHFAGFLRPAIQDIWSRQKDPIVVDVASGNSYLGFILYEMFLKPNEKGKVISVENNAELYARSQERAKKLNFGRMEFFCDSVKGADLPKRIHILTALHACDTATDDAIVRAIETQVDYLFLVPCCQAEVARLLESHTGNSPTELLYQFPHHRREFGAHLTNVIRALVLQSFGYQVRVTELTSWEHTAKGEMLIGKRVQAFDVEARKQLNSLVEEFQIKPQLIHDLFP